ncbi:PucR family transcriptional regulator [Cohnella kolymensis]|uniref:PucR family transcriptional regulator n=1 Tax=Cohnella kolymensis TaxID=1590652 RepID=UPI000696B400|nr:helix-turn-helix domain-containing protein [Cohnella kolymensis]
MNKTRLEQLSNLLNAPVVPKVLSAAEWESEGGRKHPDIGDFIDFHNVCRIITGLNGRQLEVIEIVSSLTSIEKQLLAWAIKQNNSRSISDASELEKQARGLGEWIEESLVSGQWRAEIPDSIELRNRLLDGMIPFLLQSEHVEEKEPGYNELEKTIRTFISDDTLLIPLKEHEWLILTTDRVLSEIETDGEEVPDSEETKEILSSLAEGLYDLVTGEWGGECHVAAGEPFIPAESLVRLVGTLRETVFLGRKFHVGMHVHLPWLVHLERLLSGIPEQVRSRFVEEMMGRPDLFTDPETISTLDAFFSMDCNVSETAKKLYIHRNTLLYRLDKIKHEAGLDVRSF